jgi:hypothetical protein
VDDRRPTFPIHELRESIGSDAEPVAEAVQRACTDQQVSEGFAIALRIMGVDANFQPAGALATNSPKTEDN